MLCICSAVGSNVDFDLLFAAAFSLWLWLSIKLIVSYVYRLPALLFSRQVHNLRKHFKILCGNKFEPYLSRRIARS